MKNRKLLTMLGVMALAASVFVGCSSSESNQEEPSQVEVSEDKENKLVDGTYRIEYDKADENGWKTFLEVQVEEGKISQVNFDEINDAQETNIEDDEEDKTFEEAFMNAQTMEEFEETIKDLEEAEVFKNLSAKLMEQMQTGNTETIVISAETNG